MWLVFDNESWTISKRVCTCFDLTSFERNPYIKISVRLAGTGDFGNLTCMSAGLRVAFHREPTLDHVKARLHVH